MAYDTHFQLLKPDIVRQLGRPNFSRTRRAYLDYLSVLHGLLGRYSSSLSLSIFDDPDEVEDLLDEKMSQISALLTLDDQDSSITALRNQAGDIRDYILGVMRINKETALDLYSECVSPRKALGDRVAFDLANTFINVLVDQYIYIRDPARIPLARRHTS